jgi:DNA-binding NarL/FixJ family response regulator
MNVSEPPGVAPIRVLVADAEPSVRRALKALLDTAPEIEVVGEASQSEELLSLAARHLPDVVVLTYAMPVGDGFVTTRRIKRRRLSEQVVVLTIDPSIEQEARACGADEVLLKGCTVDDLLRAIRRGSRVLQ